MERIAEVSIVAYDNGKCHGTTYGESIEVLACLVNIVEELAEIFPCECICDAVKVGIEGANEESFKILDELCSSASKQTEQQHQFKVGDRVRFKTWEQMEKEYGLASDGVIDVSGKFVKPMDHLCGTFATIKEIGKLAVILSDFTAQGRTDFVITKEMIEPSPYYCGKVVCVDDKGKSFTKGKVYAVEDGVIVGDDVTFDVITSLEHLNEMLASKFVEVKDE